MQLERDKYELRKRINNHIRDMTSWQKNIERIMVRRYSEMMEEVNK